MEPLKVQEAEKLKVILKSLMKTTVFSCDLVITISPERHGRYMEDYLSHFHHLVLNKLTLMEEENDRGVSKVLVAALESLVPIFKRHLEVYQEMRKECVRCKMVTLYPLDSFGTIIIANSLRETKAAFEHFTFERIVKIIKINAMMPCKTEGCEKLSYADHAIAKLPSVFTIALEWENNETEEEILATTSVLATEIDISKIYKYVGESTYIKYNLVSMVCSHGDQYQCVAYENNEWVRYFSSERQVIGGDWASILNTFRDLSMRPEILFFENDWQRKYIVNFQTNTPTALKNMLVQQWFHHLRRC